MLFQLRQRKLMILLFLLALLLPAAWLLTLPAASLAAANQANSSLLESVVQRGFDCKGGLQSNHHLAPLSAPDSGTATIRGRVWRDVDGDGLAGGNEPGVAEVECAICSLGQPTPLMTTTTDLEGFYSLTISPTQQNTYYLLFASTDDDYGLTPPDVGEGLDVSNSDVYPVNNPPPGYSLLGRTQNFKLAEGEAVIKNAGFVDLPSVHGLKWHDLNGDGVKDANEPALQNWQISIRDGEQSTQTMTSLAGSYGFTKLPVGEYMLSEQQQAGWLQTFPPGSGIHTVALQKGDVLLGINFGNQQLACVPPPEKMVAWWALDEQEGMISHDIAGGHDGTHINSPLPVAGMVDRALQFDGEDDYVEVADAPALSFYAEGTSQGMSDLTIDAWIRISDTSGTIVDKLYYDDTQSTWGYSFVVNDGRLELWLGQGMLGFTTISSEAFVADGEWHHVAVLIEQATESVLFYDNGMAVGEEGLPDLSFVTHNNMSPLRIGAGMPGSSPFFKGQIDEVELFNRTLLPAEIAAIYQAGSFGKCKGSIQGSKWHDLNGNGQQDANEPGLEGWTILLTTAFGEVISSTTNTAGDYAFMGLPAGNYTVAEQLQSGWQQTFPAQSSHLVPLALNEVAQEINFGNWRLVEEYCHIDRHVHLNPNWDYVELYMSIFNHQPATYEVDVMALPGMDGLLSFTTTPPTPIFVDGYEQLQVRISPLPYIRERVGPYQAMLTNIETGMTIGCMAQIWDSHHSFWLDSAEEGMQAITFGEAEELTFAFHNLSAEALAVSFEIEAIFMMPDAENQGDLAIISLNDMAPGTTISNQLTIEAGEVLSIPVTVQFTTHPAAGVGDILFSVDINNDKQSDGITSIAIRSVKEVTPTPTATMSPTPTGTMSPTPTGTMSPTPTATPTVGLQEIYLPLMMR